MAAEQPTPLPSGPTREEAEAEQLPTPLPSGPTAAEAVAGKQPTAPLPSGPTAAAAEEAEAERRPTAPRSGPPKAVAGAGAEVWGRSVSVVVWGVEEVGARRLRGAVRRTHPGVVAGLPQGLGARPVAPAAPRRPGRRNPAGARR
ncbi:hypothetical protein ACIRQQ_00945 [Streptomyces fuscichromogenes]|uniref:hypothetical protein n=1 Tax=Streptomyces fuscichromogenes TaxID=1324013 RepID=UPI00380A9E05